jgi:Cu(I)/Ag(I) efflux system periplasmic protein CusF
MINSGKVLALAIGALVALTLQQQAGAQQGGMGQGSMGQGTVGQSGMMGQPGDATAEGLVRKVDKDAGKLTIKHGPIPAMDMPMAMTMVYRVKDPAMLDQVKPGDAIRFTMEKVGGQYTVTGLKVAK